VQPVREELVIRLPLWMRVYIVGFGIFWVVFLFASLFRPSTAQPFVPILLIVVGVVFFARIISQVVIANEDGLLVRNVYRTSRYRWEDVEGFRTGRPSFQPFGKQINLLLRDGEIVPIDVSVRLWRFTGGEASVQEMLTRLRAWLPPTIPPPPRTS